MNRSTESIDQEDAIEPAAHMPAVPTAVSRLDLERAIQSLPDGCKAAFLLHDVEDSNTPRDRENPRRLRGDLEIASAQGPDEAAGEITPMSCELYDDALDAYVDGARSTDRSGAADPRLAAFEAHLSGCAHCQSLVADFTSILGAAAMLEEHLPPPRLWAKIASSIEDDARQPWWQRSLAQAFSAWIPVAAAASVALLIASASLIVWRPAPQASSQSAELQAGPGPAMAEAHHEQTIAGLQQIADAQNEGLDPDTRAVLRQNRRSSTGPSARAARRCPPNPRAHWRRRACSTPSTQRLRCCRILSRSPGR